MAHPEDIAQAAFEELSELAFTGKSVRYVVSDERKISDIAAIIGKAIGKPDLKWATFTDKEAFEGMVGAGLGEDVARNLVDMGKAVADGRSREDYDRHKPAFGKVKLEDFARDFAKVYAHE
ncbi:hypothetical protein ACFQZX_17595 [Mucilaginibacter litoreus]|uniref:NmrA-like family protein n=1 Tax=Mucilaginibacter litoreus TaxID=1048221 RepID=A0ABW3AWZ6_9SPHI